MFILVSRVADSRKKFQFDMKVVYTESIL